ncbi:MAG: sigma-70 family RNA polymerase sigma factor [Streptosporangiales bacterium]|nr:sigma-70 family RNA polymerase sigma factor [Streptosporangiales bacterium]
MAAGRGDEAAAAAFVRASQADVWRLLAHLAGRAVADDLTQETYLRAFGALRRFRGESSARTWLLSIARRTAADHLRSRARRPQVVGDAGETPPDKTAEPDPAGGVAIRMLVQSLEPERRDAFVLTQVLGLSYEEAAQVCGCPVGTIRSRVARARHDLVAALRDGGMRDAAST